MRCPAQPRKIHIQANPLPALQCDISYQKRGGRGKIPKTGKAEKQEGNPECNHHGTAWSASSSTSACSPSILVPAPPAPALSPCMIPSPFACPHPAQYSQPLPACSSPAPAHISQCSPASRASLLPPQPEPAQGAPKPGQLLGCCIGRRTPGWGALPVSKETGEICDKRRI